MGVSLNDKAWENIFHDYNILEVIRNTGKYEITSETINRYRQARLMTKFDFSTQLPEIFSKNNLSLLPITRGSYVIGSFDIFCRFQEKIDFSPIKKTFPDFITSIDFKDISSEAVAINCAYISGILNDFTNEDKLLPTISGRTASSYFNYIIHDKEQTPFYVEVKNAQIEIDGCFEGIDSLALIEAKNVLAEDFVIRQLYYPYRLLTNKIVKTVRPIFLTYSNGIFHLREYGFQDPNVYNSIFLKRYASYTLVESRLTRQSLLEILDKTTYKKEPQDIPFPQADDFERIVNLCELLYNRDQAEKIDLTQEYGFVPRQADYYANAAIYLGFVENIKKQNGVFLQLTDEGRQLFYHSLQARQLYFIKAIASHQPFGETLRLYLNNDGEISHQDVVEVMKKTPHIKVESESTFVRRARTVISWVRWIFNRIEK